MPCIFSNINSKWVWKSILCPRYFKINKLPVVWSPKNLFAHLYTNIILQSNWYITHYNWRQVEQEDDDDMEWILWYCVLTREWNFHYMLLDIISPLYRHCIMKLLIISQTTSSDFISGLIINASIHRVSEYSYIFISPGNKLTDCVFYLSYCNQDPLIHSAMNNTIYHKKLSLFKTKQQQLVFSSLERTKRQEKRNEIMPFFYLSTLRSFVCLLPSTCEF